MKILLVAALFIGFKLNTLAQFSYGIKAGISQNIIHQTPDGQWAPSGGLNPGFHVGAYGMIPITKKLALSPELQYIQKGYDDNYRFNYLELPIIVDYSVSKKIRLQAGAAIGGDINGSLNSGVSLRFADEYNDLSFIGGLKFVASKKLAILARYNQSLRPVAELSFNNGPNIDQENYTMYLKSIQLSIQWNLRRQGT